METDTDENDVFIEQDIKQELHCCSCFYEDIWIKIWNIEVNADEM